MKVILDIECNGIQAPTTVWCIVVKDIDSGEVFIFEGDEVYEEFPIFAKRITKAVGHNIIGYDSRVLEHLGVFRFSHECLLDTLVLSQLFNFKLEGGHSLENWGTLLKHPKVGLDIKDWSTYTPQMLERCINDVHLNHKVYDFLKKKIDRPEFYKAIKVEHDVAHICNDLHKDGFSFDINAAIDLYDEILIRIEELDEQLLQVFPPKEKITQLKTKVKVEHIPFNPSSPKQIVERLDEAGWQPIDRTDSGKSFKVNERNLATLPDSAPAASRKLVERLLLIARLRTLEQWFSAYNSNTGCIHGTFKGIGTWTHRMSHTDPNMGNISAEKSIKYKTEELAAQAIRYGREFRSLWKAPEDAYLVGTDAVGIQLRIFAHYINDKDFIESLLTGSSKDGTDCHSLNARILGSSRDNAKTFIYAFLLGAGDAKIAEILGVNLAAGRAAKRRFIEAYPGLARLRAEQIPADARRGYFVGFDGRFVRCNDEHFMLAGYLQNGEACIMKHANVLWRKELNGIRVLRQAELRWEPANQIGLLDYKQCNFVHDEWQTAVFGSESDARMVGRVQAESIRKIGEEFGLNIRMDGESKIGRTWHDTH